MSVLAPGRSRRRMLAALLSVTTLAVVVSVTGRTEAMSRPAEAGAAQRVVEYVGTDATFANPERGFYHHTECADDAYSVTELRRLRTEESISQLLCVFYLDGFQERDLDEETLEALQDRFDSVRTAGLKLLLRFAYTDEPSGSDAAVRQVLRHIAQLKPVLRRNADVLTAMQAGFVGAWGEWYYTRHFGDEGNISPTDWANRKKVVDALLDALPAERTVALRTPAFKRTMYGEDPLTPDEAFDGSPAARIGHHNDCFLASSSDEGTYQDREVEYPYLQQENRFLAMGGESCGTAPPRSLCPTATTELSELHWSYINIDYHPDVLESWRDGGCMSTIARRLGYRFALRRANLPDSARPGGALPVRLELRNDGYASPYGPRAVELVLRGTDTGVTRRIALPTDPRRWAPGEVTTVEETVTVPADLPAGSYALSLALPDPQPGLAARPEYAIRLANADLWDPATGRNDLRHTVTVRS